MKQGYRSTVILLLFLATFLNVVAQEKIITGTVTDESGGLPGVSVLVKGTASGGETDFDGKYSIKAKEGGVLVFSFVGMKTVEKVVGKATTVNVVMEEDSNILEEIVVTGQGVGINKKRITTTVDVLSSKEIEKTPSKQLDQLLQASSPGAQIKLSSGQPGTASIIRTRGPLSANGNTTPVIIVDGIRMDNLNSNSQLGLATGGANSSSIADIPLESIERIEYVKGGAATTLYGADAANGVIQIITKKGTVGRSVVSFEAETGVISGTERFTKYRRTGDLVFRKGTLQNYRVGLNGGTEKFRYNVSGSMYYDDSFNNVNEQVKRNIRSGFTAKITDKLTYQGSATFSSFEYSRDFNANTSFARYGNIEGGAFGNVDELTDQEFNDLKEKLREQGELTDITDRIRRFQMSNKLTYEFSENLLVNALIGFDSRSNRQENIQTNALQISKDAISVGTTDQGQIERATRDFFSLTGEINLQHKANIGEDFSFITNIGGQFFRNNDFQQSVTATGITDGAITINGGEISAADFQRGFANFGFYISENIGLWNKLYLDLGLRVDGNTAFGDDIGLLYLPKAGISYSISEEDFWQDAFGNAVSSFKLRANWGQATNFPTPFAGDLTIAANNYLGQQSFTFNNPGNTKLTSETVTTTEFGADLGFFNDRITIGGTYYTGTTEDALFTPPQSPSSGQLSQLRNIGEISNKGFEFSLRTIILNTEKHNLSFNASYNKNENLVVSSGGAPEFNVGGFTFLGSFVKEGQPLGYLRGAVTTIENGEAVIKRNQNIGTTFAPHFGSFSLNYSFDNKLNLFVNGDYQAGGQGVAVDDVLRFFNGVNDEDRFPQEILDYQAAGGGLSFFDLASYWVEDTDFIKIRNIGASYNFGEIIEGVNNFTMGFNVANPFSITNTSFDPEATGAGVSRQNGFAGGGFGFGTESAPRIYTLSLKVKL
ncbi:TonB-dependent receptor domain-containing protein [Tenacibaculum maritimum]|uniref:TonB-dependent receptor domain-containing protein n=1 Tax=Tenacibaculum maritimum TaxID=107401 RepID=UPI0012E64274|nr:TonB-dependent receptor [Tenacibaculum maritimum]CAA0149738.1 TonB-dependent receptor [Tenacibaculum maritimum]CAA0153349.1 TonB-dependent receptor [Tenacibaculum maritimum]CAA0192769.1 TonB-dependent receptor [Tenacibaculum maritimum]CAA0196729.1 TonB-dependent receptor [Tenacibaculum maritimum]CAA0199744.1 TonB-dependent receptor [Tenacibaculum maritimum]